MFSWLTNAWRVPELRHRLLFTAGILAVYRFGSWLPAPGVSSDQISNYFNQGGGNGTILGLLSLFSGGALSRFSVFALGIMPYITASIILQLLTVVIPRLEQLQKEGESGYAKINQYTRYLTVALAGMQSIGYTYLFKRQGALEASTARVILIVLTLTAGATLLMWFGEQITKRGIGNGISLLIFASILTALPTGINAWVNGGPVEKIMFPLIALGVIVAVVFVQEGQRRIPIQYAKRMVGRRMTTGGSTYMPLRVNMAGVIPVIFAAAIMAFPPTIGSFFPQTQEFVNSYFTPNNLPVPVVPGVPDRDLHLLLHRGPVQPGRPGRQPAQARRLHPGHPSRAADRAVSRPRADASHASGCAVPRRHRDAPVALHRVRRLLPGNRRRARRYLGADRCRRRARHDAADGVADDDALLRGLPPLVPPNVLLLGIQGSGKGTQAKRIASEYDSPHVATGDILRKAIEDGTPLGKQVEDILARGELVPDATMIDLIRERLTDSEGFVLDGFPRTMAQAEALDDMLAEINRPLDVVFVLQVPDDVARERLAKRALEEGRADDTPAAIDTRIATYHRETEPIVEHYRTRGHLVGIRGTGTVEEVFRQIQDALEQVAVRQ